MSERVLVCGGRDFTDRALLFRELDAEHEARGILVVIHGANGKDAAGKDSWLTAKPTVRGTDMFAHEWAYERNVEWEAYPAPWREFGKAAGPIRNRRMLEFGKPTLVLAFPGGKGTWHMVEIADRSGVPVVAIGRGALSK